MRRRSPWCWWSFCDQCVLHQPFSSRPAPPPPPFASFLRLLPLNTPTNRCPVHVGACRHSLLSPSQQSTVDAPWPTCCAPVVATTFSSSSPSWTRTRRLCSSCLRRQTFWGWTRCWTSRVPRCVCVCVSIVGVPWATGHGPRGPRCMRWNLPPPQQPQWQWQCLRSAFEKFSVVGVLAAALTQYRHATGTRVS